MKDILRKIALSVSAGSLLFSCSNLAQPTLQGQQQNLQSLNAQNGAHFQPTFDNSFMKMRPLARTGNTVVKIAYQHKSQITQLNELGMDVWMVTPQYVLGQVNDAVFERLEQSKMRFQLISPERGVSATNTFDPKYHTYQEMLGEIQQATQRSGIATLHDIGDTWQKVHGEANRDLWAVHISGKGNAEQKPGIIFLGNHHARELVTVEIPLRLINLLTSNYGKDPEITRLVDTRDIWIVPMVNPDGHIRAEQGANWRKNMNSNGGGRYRGVDLNRNYGYKFNTGGSSSRPSSDTYHGGSAFSEPETQAIRDFIKSRPNLKIMMSYHSFSNLILYPWGHTAQRVGDPKLVEMANHLGKLTGYRPQQAADLYVASGITDDYTYGELGLMSFTTEIGSWGDGFDPPYSRVDRFWDENRPAALYLLDMAGKL